MEEGLLIPQDWFDDDLGLISIDNPKPFAGFGSYRQRHGQSLLPTGLRFTLGMSHEAPAKLGSQAEATSQDRIPGKTDRSLPFAIANHCVPKSTKRLNKQRSWSSESSREEAWMKKRDQFLQDVEPSDGIKTIERSVSDCHRNRSWPVHGFKSRPRARSLTDEDLDELRGCIDLGFRFSYEEENHDLCNTLPALDLCYAINRQYIDCNFKSSPASTPDHSLDRSSCGSPKSPLCDTWKISSPGDNPQHVKTRLRHWAQAVACSIRQCC